MMQGPWALYSRDDIELLVCSGLRLPRYVERDHRGSLSFRVDQGARIPLPNDPTSPAFHDAYNAALVDAIAAETDDDD